MHFFSVILVVFKIIYSCFEAQKSNLDAEECLQKFSVFLWVCPVPHPHMYFSAGVMPIFPCHHFISMYACVIGILWFKLSFSGLMQVLADPVQEENSFIFVFHLARKQ